MSGPRLLSDSIPRVTGQVFSRKYIMLGRLVTRWAEIVGADMAAKAQPVKIRRIKGRDGAFIASLDIAVPASEATQLHYRRDLMLERINQLFGEDMVGAIRFVPIASNAPAPKRRRIIPALTPAQMEAVSTMVRPVQDVEVQARLEALGSAILQDGAAGI